MSHHRLVCTLVLLLCWFSVNIQLSVAEEPQPNPEAPRDEAELPRDVVSWSDGSEMVGTVFMRGTTHIRLFNLQRMDYVQVAISDMARIDIEIEKASMQKVWRFKEEGSPEKIYSGETYPLHEYLTRVTLRNGVEIETHLVAMMNIKIGKKEEKVPLVIKQAGGVTDNFEDLVYIKSIVFFDRRLAPNGGKLVVTLESKEKLLGALALQWSCNQSFRTNPKKGEFRWADLPPDRYDLILVTEKCVYTMLAEIPPGKSAPAEDELEDLDEKELDPAKGKEDWKLTPELKKQVVEYIAGSDEFFEVKEALLVGGNTKLVRALVRQKRVEETSYGTERKKVTLWRYDMWYLHRIQTEWRTESRAFVWRAYLPKGDDSGLLKLVEEPSLSGVDLTRPGAEVVLKLGARK